MIKIGELCLRIPDNCQSCKCFVGLEKDVNEYGVMMTCVLMGRTPECYTYNEVDKNCPLRRNDNNGILNFEK